MAPKNKFTKEEIINAAFDIAKVEGLDAITVRKVAQKLNSSIAPIYVNFNDMDELIQEVVRKAFDVANEILEQQNSGQPFRDIGIASLRFAKEYSVLYRDLIMSNNPHMKYENKDIDLVMEQIATDPVLEGFSSEELTTILFRMQVFQTGLSVMAANGLLPNELSDEHVIGLFESAAEDLISATRLRKDERNNKVMGEKVNNDP